MGNKKAQPVPVPTELDPKFVTVMAPYPFYANLEVPSEQMAMARWLACIAVEPKYLHTIWWKPSTANLVIVEVSREMPAIERLLGKHEWRQFLLRPTPEEKLLSSRAYFSFYRTTDHLQREGWKWIDIQDCWFEKWRPQNTVVRYPYPPSTWCELPREDVTNLHLCLNIPRELFGLGPVKPVVQKTTPLVPGSAEWVKANGNGGAWSSLSGAQVGNKQAKNATATKSAWNKPLVVSASATASKSSTPKQPITPLFEDDPASIPRSALPDAHVRQHLVWSDEVEEEERAALLDAEASAEPLSTGDQATVWPPPPSTSAVDDDDATVPHHGLYGDDDDDDDEWQGNGVWYAANGLVVLSPEDQKHATAQPKPKERTADSGYSGGDGRTSLEAAGWECPTHRGPLKNCPLGICPDAKEAKRRLERQKNGAWGPRDHLAQWSTGGPKMEVRAVGPGGGGRAWGTGNSRSASSSRAKSGSRPPHGGGGGGGGSEGGAWRGNSKSALRVQ